MAVDIIGNLVKIEFANSVMPVFIEKKNKDIVYFGEDNNWPSFALDAYRKHPVHNSIIKSKCKYIYGKGLTINQEKEKSIVSLAKGQAFLAAANRYESWNSVYEKTVKPNEIFNGFVWQIIWSLGGTKVEVFTLQLSKIRVSPCKKKYYYCDKWVNCDGKPLSRPENEESFKEYPAFNPNIRTGTQIYYYQVPEEFTDEYGDCYPIPEYSGALVNIATDIAVAVFQNTLAENGMTAQGMLSLFNGEPEEAKKKEYEKLFNNKFTGPRGAKVILNFVNKENDKGAEWTNFQTSDLDKQFELISKNNLQSIVTGHQVTNKSLVGISVEGALSDRTAIDISFEQMTNTYTEPRQQLILNEIKMIASLVGVNLSNLEVQRLSPLGVDITNPSISKYFTEDEIREKLGYKPKEGSASTVNAPAQTNESLRGLTGKEWMHIKRLIREVHNKKTSRAAAALMIRSAYGLNDEDINTLFTQEGFKIVEFNEQNKIKDIIQLFEAASIQESEGDTFIKEGYVHSQSEAMTFKGEPTRNDLNSILDILKGNPLVKPELIAKQLGIEADYVIKSIDLLVEKGLVERGQGTLTPTEKGINKDIPPVEVEVYTVYKYATRPDVPKAKSSRPFCEKLLQLSSEGKVWTREALESLTNELGEDAWAYRGGFYTNPNTGETEPYCRHIWKSITRSRVKNG